MVVKAHLWAVSSACSADTWAPLAYCWPPVLTSSLHLMAARHHPFSLLSGCTRCMGKHRLSTESTAGLAKVRQACCSGASWQVIPEGALSPGCPGLGAVAAAAAVLSPMPATTCTPHQSTFAVDQTISSQD